MLQSGSVNQARILIVDDEPANVRLLERILERAGYTRLASTTDPRQVLRLYSEFNPDLVILDLKMPLMDGFTVMQELGKVIPEGTFVPILVLTADTTNEARERALSMGAKDFLAKPFDHTEVLLRIRNLLETRMVHLRLQARNDALEHLVQERTTQLSETVERLQAIADHRLLLLARLGEEHSTSFPPDVAEAG